MQDLDEMDTIGEGGSGSDADMDEYDDPTVHSIISELINFEMLFCNRFVLKACDLQDNRTTEDTTAAQTREGRDIQGISWERLGTTRNQYRESRFAMYRNYENVPNSGQASEKGCKTTDKRGSYYDFRRNSRSVKSTILHFQLRNLVWATSKHDVYLMSHYSLMHWSSLKCTKSEVLNLSGHIAPSEKHPGSLLEGFTQIQVSTLAVKDKLLVAGGYHGELVCKYLDRPGVSYCTRTTYDDNAITNAVEIYTSSSGAVHIIASNNDCEVRDFDADNFQITNHLNFHWPVNHTSVHPDGNLVLVVGDDPDGMLLDFRTGKAIATLRGHSDYSFASAWHPGGTTFATGNQDRTCRIWDTRYLAKSVTALKGELGAVRSIRYTSDGRFMGVAESADYVHIFDVESRYDKEQEIDFFGEISGFSFSPDTESLYIGVWDRTYSSLIEFGRRREYSYLDAVV